MRVVLSLCCLAVATMFGCVYDDAPKNGDGRNGSLDRAQRSGSRQPAKTTRFTFPDATLEVTMRLTGGPVAAATSPDEQFDRPVPDVVNRPMLMSLLDVRPRQIVLDVKILEADRCSIRQIGLWDGRDFHRPVSLTDTSAPGQGPPSIGWGFGLGGSSRGDSKLERSGTPKSGGTGHPAGCTCAQCKSQASGSAGKTSGKSGGRTSSGSGFGVDLGMGSPIQATSQRIGSARAVLSEPRLGFHDDQASRLHVGVLLQVQPEVTRTARIQLVLIPVDMGPLGGSEAPEVRNRRTVTQSIVRDGHEVVLAGLVKKEDATSKKVPILNDVPMLGRLFKNDPTLNRKTELVIFVTPHIVPTVN